MRVLWFTNYPSLASEFLGEGYQPRDWVAMLEKHISATPEIELGIVFHYKKHNNHSFRVGKTLYYPLPRVEYKNKIKKVIERWRHNSEYNISINRYIELINDFKPDLIHIFGTEQPFGLIADMVSVPVVIQIQGNLTTYSKIWHATINTRKMLFNSDFRSLIRGIGLWHEYIEFTKNAKREQIIFKTGKNFIGRTAWDRRIVKALSSENKYYHCDEILKESYYNTVWISPKNTTPIITSNISPTAYKGIETIFETVKLLESIINRDFEWQIIGLNGDEEIISLFKKLTGIRHISKHIKFNGLLETTSLISCLLNTDLYIHPSHIENSSNSICEAMMLGMPIIATYAGGNPSIIEDNHDGILVQDGDPYSLAGAILELLENPDKALVLATNARQKAMNRHDPEKVTRKLLMIYQTIFEDK